MSVLLSQRLLLLPAGAPSGNTAASTPIAQQQNSKDLRKKMVVLGMIRGAQAVEGGTGGAPEDRAAAQTRWLDGSAGKLFGGSWDGSVRTGASCDSTSLDVRSRVAAAKATAAGRLRGGKGGASRKEKQSGDVSRELAMWNPNPDTPDPDKWGGRWGKPCGHNEVGWDGAIGCYRKASGSRPRWLLTHWRMLSMPSRELGYVDCPGLRLVAGCQNPDCANKKKGHATQENARWVGHLIVRALDTALLKCWAKVINYSRKIQIYK